MLDEAIKEYKIAIRLNPNNAKFFFNLGVAFEKKGLRDKSLNSYNKSLKINPNFREAKEKIRILSETR